MTADIEHDTTRRIERQLVDVVVRHEFDRVDLPATAFADWHTARCWQAITALWDRCERPTVETVALELDTPASATWPATVADLVFLDQGQLREVDDYIAILRAADRRRRLTILLGDAQASIAAGADPDAVLNRILEVAS